MNKLKRKQNERPQAFWGALIGAGTSLVGGLLGNNAAKKQAKLMANQNDYNIALQDAQSATNAYNAALDYQQNYLQQFKQQARLGTTRKLGSKNIMITDGGNAKRIGNNTYLLRGGSHEDINETGQTGIGINVGGNEIEAEGGEVAQRKGNSLRIYSAQPILGGISPAEAIMSGYNKDRVFNAQQRFKKKNGIKDDGSKAAFGNLITMPFAGIVKDIVDYFSNSGKYAPKRVKVSNKTVNRKPIRNGQIGNFRVVNGKYFPNEKPLRQVYPEFDIISMGRGLPIKRSLKNTIGFVQKPNTFTRGIGNSEGIKDLVESKVVRGNPVGTEMTAKAYTKATKSNRNRFNDIMNGTGRKGISHRYYNRSLSKEDFDAIRESYNKINASFKARHPKASGNIRFAIGDDVYDPLGNYKNYDDYLAQIASDRKTLRNATTINPDNGEPIAYFYDDGRNPLTQGHGYASSKWGVRISNPQDYNMKIFDGHLHYSNSKTIPFDSPNVEVFRSTPFGTIRYPKWMLRRGWYRNGGLTSKNRGSSKYPYPSVASKDFAGGNRSYPIPTKADAIDALRLAGLHGRNDVRSKVYSKYPELRKKARGGTKVEPYYDWARNTSSNLRISFIDPTYDYRTYYNSVTPYERNLIRFAPQGTHFTDIGKTPKHPTFSNESIYSNKKYPGGTWNGNVFVPNIWQFGNNGNKARDKYMKNSEEGYFNGRVNVFPKYRKRIAKGIGGLTNPPVESFKCGGRIRPKATDGMLATIYSYGTNRRRLPSFAPIDVTPRAIPNFKPVSVPTNTKTPFDPNSVPFLGRQSTFKPATQDYIGLGIDTLAALGSGLINYNSASKTYIPERTSIIQSSKLPTYYNISPQVEEIRRQRNKAFDDISHNTSSSVAAINRMNRISSDSILGIDKLYATKENEENKMLTQDALNQQSVAAENAKLQAEYEANKANILNAQNQAKADAINLSLSGLSQAWTNFAGSVESRYDNRQKEAIIAATAKDPAVLSNAVQFGYNFSPEVLAAIYNSTDDDNLKSLALSKLSTKNRLRYGIR